MGEQNDKSQGFFVNSKFGVIGVLLSLILARVAPGFSCKRLLRALGSSNEDTSMAAYMALVKLGSRNSERLLAEAKLGRQTANIVQLLGDLGDRSLIPELEQFTRSPDPKVAAAAKDSIETLQTSDFD